jgi:hypothetical protein
MTPEKAINYLLRNDAQLIAKVPTSRIFGGLIPLNTTLPAIAYNYISGVRAKHIDMTDQIVRARIQVTVHAKDYASQKEIIDLITKACDKKKGKIGGANGVTVESILADLTGPDMRDDDAGIFMQTQDFIVAY